MFQINPVNTFLEFKIPSITCLKRFLDYLKLKYRTFFLYFLFTLTHFTQLLIIYLQFFQDEQMLVLKKISELRRNQRKSFQVEIILSQSTVPA